MTLAPPGVARHPRDVDTTGTTAARQPSGPVGRRVRHLLLVDGAAGSGGVRGGARPRSSPPVGPLPPAGSRTPGTPPPCPRPDAGQGGGHHRRPALATVVPLVLAAVRDAAAPPPRPPAA